MSKRQRLDSATVWYPAPNIVISRPALGRLRVLAHYGDNRLATDTRHHR
jgi:hypothetical protein